MTRSVLGTGRNPSAALGGGMGAQIHLGAASAPAQPQAQRQRTPGTTMTTEEWEATAAVRRELVESMGHYAWSQGSDADRDERVRAEVRRRASGGPARDVSALAPAEPEVAASSTSDAIISPDGLYRYRLTRAWGSAPPLVFIMLNPSTADASIDDPTIRRCVGFAKREGAGGILVVNLFAWRSTDPEALAKASDPVGPHNDNHIRLACRSGGKVIAAWGSSCPPKLRRRASDVQRLASGITSLFALALTEDGSPRHPLYLPAISPLLPFGVDRAL